MLISSGHDFAASYDWTFPLPRTHTGMPLANGTFGALVWGEENVLKITLARADFWDHRGGQAWNERMTFASIADLLKHEDEPALRAMFQGDATLEGEPARPSILPVGRIELIFEPGTKLLSGTLDIQHGEIFVSVAAADDAVHELTLTLSMNGPLLYIQMPAELSSWQIKRVPAWEYVGEYLHSISFTPPQLLTEQQQGFSGWVQSRPEEDALCLGYQQDGQEIWVTAIYGADEGQAIAAAQSSLDAARAHGVKHLLHENRQWWEQYWADVPQVSIPNTRLSFLYYYGMYKFAGLTAPQGVAATLQGPWIEEYQMPPWSSDYHFNINVQMCYWPAYRGNRLAHLRPLFEMVWSWRETLRQNARYFVGIEDGLLLPHAVDDRCVMMGGFWSGTVDHGCTAWVAKMMYDYWLYSGDEAFLRAMAYPFMVGAMNVYSAMLERTEAGFSLPVSVSPEYRGSALNAWGRDASFQLACIHWLCESLLRAAEVLHEDPQPLWREIQKQLPLACVEGEPSAEQIMLWQHTSLEESHRHHSHLAGIAPFDVLDLHDPHWEAVVQRSIDHWIAKGMGMWSGWCMSWAAMLHMRVGNADAAELLLEIWERLFTNEGHGTLHDVDFLGISLTGARHRSQERGGEIMQMDAGMGVTTAIMEMLLHTQRGTNYLFAGAPQSWRDATFMRMRTEGGFLVSAQRVQGKVNEVQVVANLGGVFRLANPWGDTAVIVRTGEQEAISGAVLEIALEQGEAL